MSRPCASDGASAVEQALKIAFQYWHNRGITGRTTFLAFGGAYHGDTIGALSVGDDGFGADVFNALRFPVLRAPAFDDPDCFDTAARLIAEHASTLAREMRCETDFLLGMRKHQRTTDFACFIRNLTPCPVRLTVPFGQMEARPRMSESALQHLLHLAIGGDLVERIALVIARRPHPLDIGIPVDRVARGDA